MPLFFLKNICVIKITILYKILKSKIADNSMQKDYKVVGDLELFFRLGRERVIRAKEMEDYEVERMLYWVQEGEVSLEKRKDLDFCTEDEFFFTMTEKGNKDYREVMKYVYNKMNRLKLN